MASSCCNTKMVLCCMVRSLEISEFLSAAMMYIYIYLKLSCAVISAMSLQGGVQSTKYHALVWAEALNRCQQFFRTPVCKTL